MDVEEPKQLNSGIDQVQIYKQHVNEQNVQNVQH